MKKLITLFLTILSASWLHAQVPEHIYFIAGMPDTKFYQDNFSQVYTTNILKYERGTLTEILTLSDSSQFTDYLRYYPDLTKVIVLNDNRESKNEKRFDILEFSTKSFKIDKQSIPNEVPHNGNLYNDYRFALSVLTSDDRIESYIEYYCKADENCAFEKELFGVLVDESFVIKDVSIQQRLYINGSMGGPFFGSNNGLLPLQAHPTERLLVIPSYLKDDSVFHTVIPENAVLTPKRYNANMIINTDQIRLMYYYKGKDGKPFYDLYNKAQNRYYQYPFDNSNQNVKQYGDWIAGPTRLQYVDKGTYQGPQPGQDQWNPNDNKYGLSVAEYIDRKLKTMILSGYLAIRSIHNPSIFIEWDTKQGDSEILGIHEDIVYYRKHDEVWYVPIVQGKQLGQHEMLLKDEAVPGIHFMFVRE